MDTKHICYLLIGIIGFSCTDVKREIKNDYVLEVLPEKCFELDDYTVQNCYCLQYIPQNDWFCFSNTPDNSITINDFKTGKLIKKIHFSKEGNNGVGSVSSFYLADTLVYLHHHWNRKVYITDTTAKVVNKISIDLEKFIAKGITPPSILPQISSPIQIAKNKLNAAISNVNEYSAGKSHQSPTKIKLSARLVIGPASAILTSSYGKNFPSL